MATLGKGSEAVERLLKFNIQNPDEIISAMDTLIAHMPLFAGTEKESQTNNFSARAFQTYQQGTALREATISSEQNIGQSL